jgi:hypothetical protein
MPGVQLDQGFTDKMVRRAIAECAEKHFAGDIRRVRQVLLSGKCEHCNCISDSLVVQISQYLGQVDQKVKAVYVYEPVSSIQPLEISGEGIRKTRVGINLVAWVERKSAALGAVVNTLETALYESLKKIGCIKAESSCFTLDVEMVDDEDVEERRGYALLVESRYLRAKTIWDRSKPPIPAPTQATKEASRVRFDMPDSFDPELIPEGRLIEHARSIEKVPPEQRGVLEHHLMELKVILIRRMISDQLAYIDIAKRWFTIADMANILKHKIGDGRIGGKSAGMLLAARILNQVADQELLTHLQIPESYFLGSDLIYIFMAMNGLMYWNDQKYKPEDQIRLEYQRIQEEFQQGKFPPEVLVELRELLDRIGNEPIIVRSSSQLEDNFGTSFAGKYDSFFLPNQGTADENLSALTNAIARTYASTLKPEALLYRRSKGLEDYDERMAVLIQVVQGDQFGRYYLPHAAGVAFSHNIYRWSPDIQREAGFARIVWGLGTRAVERVGDDYPRLVALSHPNLQPDDSVEAIRRYSQRYVDLIDLEDNQLKTLPIHEVLTPGYPILRLIAQLESEGYFSSPRMRVSADQIPKLAITYQELLHRTSFPQELSRILRLLEQHYHSAVDMEFTLNITDPYALEPEVQIILLQCRPQSFLQSEIAPRMPEEIDPKDIAFSTQFIVPQGYLADIRFVIFVIPDKYFQLPSSAARHQIARVIAALNSTLPKKSFICIGPGRWGSTNVDLGVFVSYADIHNAAALVELTGRGIGPASEPSLGTHFFQDLMEAQIYPLAIPMEGETTVFNHEFFYTSNNHLDDWISNDQSLAECVRLIEVSDFKPEHHLELVMDDNLGKAVAFFVPDVEATEEK